MKDDTVTTNSPELENSPTLHRTSCLTIATPSTINRPLRLKGSYSCTQLSATIRGGIAPQSRRNTMAEEALHELMKAADTGNAEQRQRLFATLYDELHRLAQRELRRNAQATLSPTTLLHETFLNVCARESAPSTDRGRFMAYAARAMRGLLLNYLRDRLAQKRGGQFEITSLPTELPIAHIEEFDGEKLSAALDALSQVDARLAECVDLKFFCGFTFADIAQMRSVSERTVQRDWEKARILLHQHLDGQTIG